MADLERKVKWAERTDKNADPTKFYRENYRGVSRGKLARLDFALYRILYRSGLLGRIPKERNQHYGCNPLQYYHQHYEGLTRTALQKEDSALYQKLWKEGLLGEVPKKPSRVSRISRYTNPLEYYHGHYEGLTRGELIEKNATLYDYIRRKGLLEQIPRKNRDWPKTNLLEYYHQHYEGLTRGELQDKDEAFYKQLLKNGLLKHVPTMSKEQKKQRRRRLEKVKNT